MYLHLDLQIIDHSQVHYVHMQKMKGFKNLRIHGNA
jgi:hypothetical protein